MIKQGVRLSLFIIGAMVLVSVYSWTVLPNATQIPIHWDIDGNVNGTAGKIGALFGLPALSLFMLLVFAGVPRLDPRVNNLKASRQFYLSAWIGSLVISAAAHFVIIYSAVKGSAPALDIIFIITGVFLIVLGNYMSKTRSNWFAGIRTPWTLSSEHSWSVTHRFAGLGFILSGGLSILGLFTFGNKAAIYTVLTGLGLTVVFSVVISYIAWRDDPDRS